MKGYVQEFMSGIQRASFTMFITLLLLCYRLLVNASVKAENQVNIIEDLAWKQSLTESIHETFNTIVDPTSASSGGQCLQESR